MKAITRRQALTGLASAAGASLLGGCAINPVTGKRELMLMTETQEISLGAQAHEEISAQYGVYEDSGIQQWFDARGQAMAKVTHRANLSYTFTVLDSPVVNAFAVPGGYVYVTRGILGYFNNEAQFAGVLAHELGHVNARHSAARYSKSQLASLALNIGSIFSEEFANYAQFASLGMSLMFLRFSRDDEREADRLGVEYSSKVGYDATEMSTFFHTLERLNPGGGSLPSWMSTHPDPGDRVNSTKNQALEFQQVNPGKEYVKKRNEYLEVVDGIVFGDDPRQGYVKDGIFIHPDMSFQFPVPAGWNLTNSPSEVRMGPEDGNAVVIFSIAPGSTPEDAMKAFAANNSVIVLAANNLKINEMNAFSMAGIIKQDESEIAILSHFIKKDTTVFVFHGVTASANSATYAGTFRTVATGFNVLTDRNLKDVSPLHIEMRTVDTNKLLSKAFNDFGVPESRIEELAVINGMELYDMVQAGTRIKIIT